MAFFPRSFITSTPSEPSFNPLFRLLDDFDTYSRSNTGHYQPRRHQGHVKTYTPKFDVRELADSYELHGELPGIEQKDVEIEFTDHQTLTVRGRTERQYTSSNSPAADYVEITKPTEEITAADQTDGQNSHKATVEDEDAPATQEDTTSTEVTKHEEEKPQEPQAKFWVSERSVGEFSRTFSFPIRVDQDGVRASMKNGVLSVVIPKAKKVESRKITIN